MDPTVGYWPVKDGSHGAINLTAGQKSSEMLSGFGYNDVTLPHTHTTYVLRSSLSYQLSHYTVGLLRLIKASDLSLVVH